VDGCARDILKCLHKFYAYHVSHSALVTDGVVQAHLDLLPVGSLLYQRCNWKEGTGVLFLVDFQRMVVEEQDFGDRISNALFIAAGNSRYGLYLRVGRLQ